MHNVKIHHSYRGVVAVCDSELLGKYFDEGRFQLDIKESFYKGDEVSGEELLDLLRKMAREDATFNIIGKDSVDACIKIGLINEASVKKIAGIPYAMILA